MMKVPSKLAPFVGRSLLVDGLGDDAVELAEFLAKVSDRITVLVRTETVQENEPRIDRLRAQGLSIRSSYAGEPVNFADAEVLFVDLFTPARAPLILSARERGLRLSNLADVILRTAPEHTIGITGSAGKTTTTFLLTSILRAAGIPVRGSTDDRLTPSGPGHAMLADLYALGSSAWRVLELTSHHLDYVSVSPRIGVVTNFFPDHQDWHGSLSAYRSAKRRLLDFQRADDLAILNFDDEAVRTDFANGLGGRKVFYSMSDDNDSGVVVSEGYIANRSRRGLERICALADLAMPSHHIPNALAAAAAAFAVGAETAAIGEALRNFRGLPQRSYFLGKVDGVEIYDDTIAMNPRKALSGLQTFSDKSLIVVAGGALESPGGEKRVNSELEKQDLRRFCMALERKARGVVVFGAGGSVIGRLLSVSGRPPIVLTEASFEHALERAISLARPDGRILLAPVFYNPATKLKQTLEGLLRRKIEI
ncbi:Mur ligase family protein [Bradyrhizobium sp. SSUT77]|uniref:Mur ligase family protein n=1 Tax=Bradyrhizobium sp. SSUT77 TaxID=3040603 RepID=UPI00244CA114|nr:Mur ligase family protein [Bradyrhizobium sp. SSUT77]MDH2347766.1 Mur ligase family protein [Bradyrhizobium sp. SSUT77]